MKSFLLSDQSSLIPLLLIFLSINSFTSVLAVTGEYANCSQAITCRSVTSNISYPFWGANRPRYCGKSGFEVTCKNDIPFITMNNINFRILGLETSSITPMVKMAREDYWGTLCPSTYVDTQLNFSLFTFSSGILNVSLYYGCTNSTSLGSTVAPKVCSNDDSD